MKVCSRCSKAKPWSDFPKDPKRRDGLYPWCKACKRGYMRDHNQRNRSRRTAYERARRLPRRYGITVAEYDALLARQGGGCAICGATTHNDRAVYLAVDHDHETDEVRGLLCDSCNRGLGYFADDPARLHRAAEYLSRKVNHASER